MKIRQALEGVAALSEHVDAILVINNEKLKQIYPDLELSNAFAKADDVLTNAAKAIAEIITIPGYINTDFADVYSIMKDGHVAIMNTGYASGEGRITKAIEDALNSPLLNTNDVSGASKILLSLYCSTTDQIRMEEVEQIHEFMSKVGENVQVIWGASFDDELKENVKITLIATGFDVSDIPGMPVTIAKAHSIKPVMSAEASKFFEAPKKEAEPEIILTEKEETEVQKKADTEKAFEQYYVKSLKNEPEPELELVPDLPVFNLDDLEDDAVLKNVENVPAWKRRLMK
jgi:cell division protein FtsZ